MLWYSVTSVAEATPLIRFSTLQEADRLFAQLPQELVDRLVIVGGVALWLWGEQYLLDELTGFQRDNLASDDLDLLGDSRTVEACASVWGGECRTPTFNDHTVASGLIALLQEDGTTLLVDFLHQVFFIPTKDVHRYADRIIFGGKPVKVLSPYLCLLSRIWNLHGLPYNQKLKEREVVRITLAASACRSYLHDRLSQARTPQDIRQCCKIAKYIAKRILGSRAALDVAVKYGVDIDFAIPAQHPAWPIMARTRTLPHWIEKHNCRVDRLRVQHRLYLEQKNQPIPAHLTRVRRSGPPPA